MKSILFDFGGTLDSDGANWLDRFYPLYREAGVEVPRESFDRAFYDSDDRLAKAFPLAQATFEQTLSHQVGSVLAILAPSRVGLRDGLVSRFLEGCRSHFRRNRPLLARLKTRYRLGIVSNYYGNLDSCLRSEGIRDLFDFVADSGALGAEKPDPEIFRHAMRALSVDAADCVMVGDSIPRDMRGAEGLLMRHALVTSRPESRCCPEAQTLSRLVDLEEALGLA